MARAAQCPCNDLHTIDRCAEDPSDLGICHGPRTVLRWSGALKSAQRPGNRLHTCQIAVACFIHSNDNMRLPIQRHSLSMRPALRDHKACGAIIGSPSHKSTFRRYTFCAELMFRRKCGPNKIGNNSEHSCTSSQPARNKYTWKRISYSSSDTVGTGLSRRLTSAERLHTWSLWHIACLRGLTGTDTRQRQRMPRDTIMAL
jgi:hypothetical protein